LGEITEADVERRGDKGKSEDNRVSKENIKKESQDRDDPGKKLIPDEEYGDDDQVHEKYQQRIERSGDDNGPAGDIDFGYQSGFLDERIKSRHGAFREEVKKHYGG